MRGYRRAATPVAGCHRRGAGHAWRPPSCRHLRPQPVVTRETRLFSTQKQGLPA